MHTQRLALFATLALFLVAAGCEDSDKKAGVSWNGSGNSGKAQASSASAQTSTTSAQASSASTQASSGTSATSTSDGASADAPDAVAFSALHWTFGGVNGSGAAQSGVVISGLGCSRDGMSFRYVKDLSAWGRGYGEAGDYACLFVQKSDGSWVGGKFDWISSSRTTRGFENIRGGYSGWSLAGVPNPCNVAFVILNHDCKRRSNVVAGHWTR